MEKNVYSVTQVIHGEQADYFFQSESLEDAIAEAEEGSKASPDGVTYRHHVVDSSENVVFECGDEIEGYQE
jgi:hypothetical protein